jgi:hypothetical protein
MIGQHILALGSMHFKPYRTEKIEIPIKASHYPFSCVHFIVRILMKICFYYKKDSSLIFSHIISAENRDFTLFQLKNALKIFPLNSSRDRKNR